MAETASMWGQTSQSWAVKWDSNIHFAELSFPIQLRTWGQPEDKA